MHVHTDMYTYNIFKTAGHRLKDRKHFLLSQHHKDAHVHCYSQCIQKQHDSKVTIMLQAWSSIIVTLLVTPWISPEPLHPATQVSIDHAEELTPVLHTGESNDPQDSGNAGLRNSLGNCSLSDWPLISTHIPITATQKKATQKSVGAHKEMVVWLSVDQNATALQSPLKSGSGCRIIES